MTLRRTGRTTRLVEQAVLAARHGNYVFLVAANGMQAGMIYNQIKNYKGTRAVNDGKIYIDPNGSISVVTLDDQLVNMRNGTYEGAHPSCKFFADHFAIESYLNKTSPWAYREFIKQNGIGI